MINRKASASRAPLFHSPATESTALHRLVQAQGPLAHSGHTSMSYWECIWKCERNAGSMNTFAFHHALHASFGYHLGTIFLCLFIVSSLQRRLGHVGTCSVQWILQSSASRNNARSTAAVNFFFTPPDPSVPYVFSIHLKYR